MFNPQRLFVPSRISCPRRGNLRVVPVVSKPQTTPAVSTPPLSCIVQSSAFFSCAVCAESPLASAQCVYIDLPMLDHSPLNAYS